MPRKPRCRCIGGYPEHCKGEEIPVEARIMALQFHINPHFMNNTLEIINWEARLSGKGEQIIIVGMDHDQRALAYLRDGIIYALALQDCYAIGFDTITTAVKIADGILPGSLYSEKTEEKTEIYYQNEASDLLSALYGMID